MPRVLAVTRGSTVGFSERRSVFPQRLLAVERRDVRSRPLSRGHARSRPFTKPGLVKVYCHIHSHMSASILVLDHPYFTIPDLDGTFTLADVPAGQLHARRLARARRRTERERFRSKPGGRRRSTCRCRSRTAVIDGGAPPRLLVKTTRGHLRHRGAAAGGRFLRRHRERAQSGAQAPSRDQSRIEPAACSRRSRPGASASCACRRPTSPRARRSRRRSTPTRPSRDDRERRHPRAVARRRSTASSRRSAARIEADAIVVVDARQNTLAAAGRLADRLAARPAGERRRRRRGSRSRFDGVAHIERARVPRRRGAACS